MASTAQPGYEPYQTVNGLILSTKWGKAKNEAGEKKPALLMKIENTNDHPVDFSFAINFYYEGILRENGKIENQCLEGLKSAVGKLNGVYFIPTKFSPDQLKSSDFEFTLESIEVVKSEGCE
jgi:hypothetical protein